MAATLYLAGSIFILAVAASSWFQARRIGPLVPVYFMTGWLAGELAKVAGEDPERIAEQVATAAIRRQGGEPRDDIALLVLRRKQGRRKAARGNGAVKRTRAARA